MKDITATKKLFDRLKIPYKTKEEEYKDEKIDVLKIEEGEGYSFFFAEFNFDKKGKFINYGIWE